MTGQTEIPGDFGESTSGPCRWCGAPSVGVYEVASSQLGTHRGREVLKWQSVKAPACRECLERLQSQPAPVTPEPYIQGSFDLGMAA